MKGFKVGNYVVFKKNNELMCFNVPCFAPGNIYVVEDTKLDGTYVRVLGIWVAGSLFRIATNNDFINTLRPEQKAIMLAQMIMDRFTPWGSSVTCDTLKWLNKPYNGWEIKNE